MTGDERMHPTVVPATASQPQRLVLSPHRDSDDAQASGEWIAAVGPVEVKR